MDILDKCMSAKNAIKSNPVLKFQQMIIQAIIRTYI